MNDPITISLIVGFGTMLITLILGGYCHKKLLQEFKFFVLKGRKPMTDLWTEARKFLESHCHRKDSMHLDWQWADFETNHIQLNWLVEFVQRQQTAENEALKKRVEELEQSISMGHAGCCEQTLAEAHAREAVWRPLLELVIDPLLSMDNFPDTPEELMDLVRHIPFEIQGEVLAKCYEALADSPKPSPYAAKMLAAVKLVEGMEMQTGGNSGYWVDEDLMGAFQAASREVPND